LGIHKIKFTNTAGIGSDMNHILSGMQYCFDNSHKCIVEWYSFLHSKIDENGNYENLFNKFFYQDTYDETTVYDTTYENITPYKSLFASFWSNDINNCIPSLNKVSELVKNSNLLNSNFFRSLDQNYFKNEKVLGIHRRGTNYKNTIWYLDDDVYFRAIDMQLKNNNFDKIFLITDDLDSFENFKNQYGNQLIYTDSFKTKGIDGPEINSFERGLIAEQTMMDAFYLSQTDFKILVKSNLSIFSLLLNFNKDKFIVL